MDETDNKTSRKTVLIFISVSLIILLAAALIFLSIRFVSSGKKSSSDNSKITLELKSPPDSFATNQPTLKISGSTGKASVVTVANESTQKIIQAENGKFSTDVALIEGKNTINIVAFDPTSGQSKTINREVLYLNEDLSGL